MENTISHICAVIVVTRKGEDMEQITNAEYRSREGVSRSELNTILQKRREQAKAFSVALSKILAIL